ncbi:glycosyltransferase [Balneola sp. MJW-20]|uniref:glycosyltransferase n=1 Tax=Gracilimonas aurantiaca TaxID=3234185 RepID=UPI003465B477
MADQSKRLLMFAPYFPPRRRVGAIRSYRFASALASGGWKVKVICLATPGGELTETEREALKDVEISEISSPIDKTTAPSRSSIESKKVKKEGWVSKWIDDQFPIDTWYPLFRLYKNRITELISEFNPDVIWSTSDPWSSNMIIADISERLSIPWVADQRDPWTLCDVRFPENGPIARFAARRAEKKIMDRADHIVFTALETTKKYIEAYPEIIDKVSTIYNSYDPSLINSPGQTGESQYFDLLFLGRFRPLSSAAAITDVLRKLKEKYPGLASKVRVISYGALSPDDMQRVRDAGLELQFVVRERVPNEKVPAEISGADMLLLSTEMDRNDIIPAKLIDYLPYDKPVLSLNESPEVQDILKKTNRGVQFGRKNFDEAAEFLAQAIRKQNEGKWPLNEFEAVREEITPFEITYTKSQLEEILLKVSEDV